MAELSGLEVSVLVKEIRNRLRGTYVNNVYSIGETQLIRFRRPGGEDVWLVASPRYGAWISEKVSDRAATTAFTTQLRGELSRAMVEDVSQVDLDRIYDLSFAVGETRVHLILELMPPGNLLVTDAGRTIQVALRESKSPTRKLGKGLSYTPPTQRRASPEDITTAELEKVIGSETTVGKVVGRRIALPRKYVQAVLRRLNLDEDTGSAALAGRAEELASALRELVIEAKEHPSPSVCETPSGDEIFAVVPNGLTVKKKADTMSELCDELFLPQVFDEMENQAEPVSTKKGEIETTLERLNSQEMLLLEEAQSVRAAALEAAAALTAEDAWNGAKSHLPAETTDRAKVVSQAGVASLLFDRAKELEKKADDVKAAARTLQRRLSKQKGTGGRRTRELRRNKLEWYEKFRWFYTSEGKLAIGGRDAQSNSILVKRHLESNDTIYHADLFGSPFFVLKNGKEQTAEEVLEVAQATVSFSSAWKTGLGAADAYWVSPDQVGISAPSGEYLPRGSFLIKGKKNMVLHVLVQIAVGVDPPGRVVSGPESAVSKVSPRYVVLTPHKEKSSETAKRVSQELELRASSPSSTLDDVIRALPAGGGKVVRKRAPAARQSDTQ